MSLMIPVASGGSSPGPEGMPPPLAAWQFFFASILILLLSRLDTMGRGNTKVAVCRRILLSNRLVFAAFCCLCAVHCMQAAVASFVSPKAVFLACAIGSWTAKNSAQNALEVDIFRSKVKKIFWGGNLRRLDTRACGARPWPHPPFANPGSATAASDRLQEWYLYAGLFWRLVNCTRALRDKAPCPRMYTEFSPHINGAK